MTNLIILVNGSQRGKLSLAVKKTRQHKQTTERCEGQDLVCRCLLKIIWVRGEVGWMKEMLWWSRSGGQRKRFMTWLAEESYVDQSERGHFGLLFFLFLICSVPSFLFCPLSLSLSLPHRFMKVAQSLSLYLVNDLLRWHTPGLLHLESRGTCEREGQRHKDR